MVSKTRSTLWLWPTPKRVVDEPAGELPERSGDADLTALEAAILQVVNSLNPGDVVTYGEVAVEAGRPGAARAVGSTLRRHGSGVPWWRVVAANGRLVPGGEARQRRHLVAEGVVVHNGRVAMGNAGS